MPFRRPLAGNARQHRGFQARCPVAGLSRSNGEEFRNDVALPEQGYESTDMVTPTVLGQPFGRVRRFFQAAATGTNEEPKLARHRQRSALLLESGRSQGAPHRAGTPSLVRKENT